MWFTYLAGFVADHFHNGHAHIAPNTETDHEANRAEQCNRVPLGEVRLARAIWLHEFFPPITGTLVHLLARRGLMLFPFIVA